METLEKKNVTAAPVQQMQKSNVAAAAAAAGIAFDVLGALLLLHGEMKPNAAHERHLSKTSPERNLHLAQRKTLPYYQQFPLWFARKFGSSDVMASGREPDEKAFARRFWALVFLVVGFVLQLVAALVA